MYLIDASTFELKWFPAERPPYAILSHTWGPEEVTFGDLNDLNNLSKAKLKSGFNKVKLTCEQSIRDGVKYAWIDTCCINKESSSELSEAINSMFRWYEEAICCYAYIEDIPESVGSPATEPSVLRTCKWFSRGWTLQELLAPKIIIFFGPKWDRIGTKEDMNLVLADVTGIPAAVLTGSKSLGEVSVADRMGWAAGRKTTREEDIAYSLMGIFDVNMPMLYGEGQTKAFIRLQEEILRQTQDDSLFAWQASDQSAFEKPYRGLFALSPKEFASNVSITPFHTTDAGGTSMLGNGHVSLSCVTYKDNDHISVLGLKCYRGADRTQVVSIKVVGRGGNSFLRAWPSRLVMRPHKNNPTFETVKIEKFTARSEFSILDDIYRTNAVHVKHLPAGFRLKDISPAEFANCAAARTFPLVNLMGKKVTITVEVDKEVAGISMLEQLGWYTDMPSSAGGKGPISLSLWVEPLKGSASHKYCFDVSVDTRSEKPSRSSVTSGSTRGTEYRTIPIGWSTLKVTGRSTQVDGYTMFCIDWDLSVEASLKVAAEEDEARQKSEAEIRRQAVESERRAKELERQLVHSDWQARDVKVGKLIAAVSIGLLIVILLSVVFGVGITHAKSGNQSR